MSIPPTTVIPEADARNSSVAPMTRVVVSSASVLLAKPPPMMSKASVSLPISGSVRESYDSAVYPGATLSMAQNQNSHLAALIQVVPGASNDDKPVNGSSAQSASCGKKNAVCQGQTAIQISDSNISGRWTAAEHKEFLKGLKVYGREWKRVAILIPSRTSAQIRSHAQKYFMKVSKHQQQLLALAEKRRTSFPDAMPSKSDAYVLLHDQSMSQSFIDKMNLIVKNPSEAETRMCKTLASLKERYKQLEDRLQQVQYSDSLDAPIESEEAALCPATAALELEQKSLRKAAEARYEMKKRASQLEKKQTSILTETNATPLVCVSLASMPSQGGFDSNDVIALSMLGSNLGRGQIENKTMSTKTDENAQKKFFPERRERPTKFRKVDER